MTADDLQCIIEDYCETEDKVSQLDERTSALVGNHWHSSDDPRAVRSRASYDALWRKIDRITEKIIDTPARSAHGIALKLRFMLCLIEGCAWSEFFHRLLRSAAADASRLLKSPQRHYLARLVRRAAPAVEYDPNGWDHTCDELLQSAVDDASRLCAGRDSFKLAREMGRAPDNDLRRPN